MSTSTISQADPLVKNLLELLEAHRPLFRQVRIYWRIVGLVFGEIFAFGRHTVTQLLLALGLTDEDWSAWYRVFSQRRFKEEQAAAILLQETLTHVAPDEVYVIGVDATQVPRSSHHMEGTSWLKCPRTPPFRTGIHRAQRFVNGCWLTPPEEGYCRAIPLRWWPAFTEKAVRQVHDACKEWEAGLQFVDWVRAQLNRHGRTEQPILVLGDANYDTVGFWRALPTGVIALTGSARNRCLYALPEPPNGRGRRRKYGERAPAPSTWLTERRGWQRTTVHIRGQARRLTYRVHGPYLREGAPDTPLFLIVVRGERWQRRQQARRRNPRFYLVNAIQQEGQWVLPLPIEVLLFWAWHRWELEVVHREIKSGLGLGEKQCWNPHAAVLSVQWSAWLYAVLVLAGYRSWGLCNGPSTPAPWWPGAHRWSLNTLWRGYRAALWGDPHFHPLWLPSSPNWWKKEAALTGLFNAVYGSARA
jgi:hypothetical protein